MNSCRFVLRFAVVLFAAAMTCQLARAFEGKVEMNVTTADGSMPMTYFIKGTKMRMEMLIKEDEQKSRKSKKKKDAKAEPAAPAEAAPTMRSVTIINTEAREMISYMEQLKGQAPKGAEGGEVPPKFYMKMTLPEAKQAKETGKAAAEAVFTPTGRTETIAGYQAEEYVSTNKKGERTEMWVTKELGRYFMASQGKGGKSGKAKGWEEYAQGENLFPLRVIIRKKEGEAEIYRMEVVKIDKSSVADTQFQPPADYQPMPSLKDMMKGAIPGFGS